MANKIFFTQAWDNDRKLGKYYNEFMAMLPDNCWGCITDYDVQFLTNDYGKHLYEYINQNPNATMTCRTNRLHESNKFQQLEGIERDNHNINYHRGVALRRKAMLYKTTDFSNPPKTQLMGGMLMLIKKEVWKECKFGEQGILNVDNNFHRALIEKHKQVLVMEGIYVYHWYRQDGSKAHLL